MSITSLTGTVVSKRCLNSKEVQCVCNMSGGHFTNSRKKFFLRRIQGDGKVQFEEKVSHFTSTTSRDPLLIAKCDEPKVESHYADRIIKNIQIQTGAGKTKEEEVVAKQICSQLEADTTDTDSSISLDFDDQVVEASLDNKRGKKLTLKLHCHQKG